MKKSVSVLLIMLLTFSFILASCSGEKETYIQNTSDGALSRALTSLTDITDESTTAESYTSESSSAESSSSSAFETSTQVASATVTQARTEPTTAGTTISVTTSTRMRLKDRLTKNRQTTASQTSSAAPKPILHGSAFFDDAAEDIGMELSGQQVRFTYENTVGADERIIADAEQVRRAISNIVSNSLKYMDKEEKIMSMTVGEEGDFVQVRITDNGQGIPKQDIANVFNRFYRADTSRHAKGGSGIGLSIVRKIMEDHGGRVYALSEEGVSTTMVLEFRKYTEVRQEYVPELRVERSWRRRLH